jgi:succinyl-CoA synthetase beta subunit
MQLKSRTRPAPKARRSAACYIEDGADIKKEYYVSVVTDRATQKWRFIASSEGGMDIEEVAHATPEKIITEFIDPADRPDAKRRPPKMANGIGMPADSTAQCRGRAARSSTSATWTPTRRWSKSTR